MSNDADDPTPPSSHETPADWPHPVYNWMSGIGVALAAVAISTSVLLVLVEWIVGEGSGYAGLTLLPLFLLALVGAGLVLAGWLRERRRQRRGEHSSFFETFVVDPWAIVRERGAWFIPSLIAAATLVLLGVGAGSLGALHYSESNQFCTDACHAVMGPEGAVYEHTAHARIDCVACHVGAGPEGFLTAKLGGMRQLYLYALGEVTRPIPTPLHEGVITRATCESCHHPGKDVGMKAETRSYFLSGEDAYRIRMAMGVKVGRGGNEILPGEGVHYHMQIAKKIEYVARDEKRQDIPWVRVTDADGEVVEYENESYPLEEDERASLPVRTMECVDCHNRAAHRFPSPVESVNEALEARYLPRDMPSIKVASVMALDGDYESTDEALEGIDERLREFYEEEYPEVLEERGEDVEETVTALRTIYQDTIFPEMEADWQAHPDNGSHLETLGCFRCHNDEMVDDEGDPITTGCTSCHAILAQDGESGVKEIDTGQPFLHPEDGSEMDEFTLCSDCHTGGVEVYE